MHRSQRFLIGKKIFLGEQRPGKWPWILVSAVSSERSIDSRLPPPAHALASKAVHLGVVSSALGRTSVSSSLSIPWSHLPTSHSGLPLAFPSQTPTTPPMMISLLPDVIICRKSKHHVCEHKILSFIYATDFRKEKRKS